MYQRPVTQLTYSLDIFDDFSPVFKARVCVFELQAALFQKLTNKSTDPT